MKNLPKNLQQNLVLWLDWSVSGTTAYDLSWNSNNWTTSWSPTTQRVLQNKGFTLNGSSQYIIPWFLPSYQNLTLSFAVKIDNISVTNTIFAFRNSGNWNPILASYVESGSFNFRLRNNSGGNIINIVSPAISQSIYYLMAYSINTSTWEIILYQNWIPVASWTYGWWSITVNSDWSAIWVDRFIARQYLVWNVINPMIWNRTLSPTEIQQLYYSTYIK